MRRFLPVYIGWLILEAILLSEAAAFLPADPFLLRAATALAFVRVDLDPGATLCTESSSFSQKLNLLCKQENEHNCTPILPVNASLRVQKRAHRWSFVQTRGAALTTFFFLQRFSSASAEDDPFPS
jgi:hypothetical protein